MPGAQPSANPAQREDFENRCRQLHRDEEQERLDRLQQAYEQRAAAAPDLASTSELEAMFPTLDAELDAVDTLLALTLAAEPLEAPLPTLPPLEVGMDDHDKFPALTDAEGWQVANQKLFDRDPEEDLGSAWRDRAKAAQDMPAPKAAVAPAKPRSGAAKAKKEAAAVKELKRADDEKETNITKILRLIDSDMVDDTPGAVNALTRKGTAFVTLCSSLSFHALRLILRDAVFRSAATSPKAMMKRKVAEHYMLSAIHAFSCSVFSLRKLLSNRWTSAVGSEAMLCFSLGYTSYTLLALRSQLFSDPLFAVNELANFVKHWSCLRAQGFLGFPHPHPSNQFCTGWIVPLLLSAEIPTACLDLLRMLAEVGLSPSSLAWRFCLLISNTEAEGDEAECLGAFTTSFIAVKGLLLPICLGAEPWLPAILYALARKPGPPDQQAWDLRGASVIKYRLAAGSALLGLGVLAEPLQKDRRYLLAVMPHGVIPFANTLLSITLQRQGFIPNSIGADILFQIPVLRLLAGQLVRFGGLIPATPQSIKRALAWPYPNNITFIVPGGIAEIFLTLTCVFIKSRKGFIRLALQAGVDIVPVYGLGHTQLFTMLDKSSGLGGFMMRMSRRLKSAGHWAVRVANSEETSEPLIPYAKPVAALVGKPIRIDAPDPNPSAEKIDELHARFVQELLRIFEKHKAIVPGYENKQLYLEDEEVPPLPTDALADDVLFPSNLPAFKSRMKLNPDAQCVFQSTQQVRIECHFEHIPGPWSKPQGTADEKVEDEEVDEFLTDYDFRHRVGQQRAKHRARYGRGSGRGAEGHSEPALGTADLAEVVVELSWDIPSQNVVLLDQWLNTASPASHKFLKAFAPKRAALNEYLQFVPHYHVFSLEGKDYKDLCSDSTGRYCADDPDGGGEITGKQVLHEAVRQLCIHEITVVPTGERIAQAKRMRQAKFSTEWWDYVSKYLDECPATGSGDDPLHTFGEKCSERLMHQVGLDVEKVEECIRNTKEDKLAYQRENSAWSSDALRINGWRYSGTMDADLVTKAICAGFISTPEPCTRLTTPANPFNLDGVVQPPVASGVSNSQVMEVFIVLALVAVGFMYFYKRSMTRNIHTALREEVMLEVQSQMAQYKQLGEVGPSRISHVQYIITRAAELLGSQGQKGIHGSLGPLEAGGMGRLLFLLIATAASGAAGAAEKDRPKVKVFSDKDS
eukprot:s5158_g2.t2